MIVKCNRIISSVTQEDLGGKSPCLEKEKYYLVFALSCSNNSGVYIYIQTENFNEPTFVPLDGFEIITQHIPKSWVTSTVENEQYTVFTMEPKSWSYEDFYEEVLNEHPETMELYRKEALMMYEEEAEMVKKLDLKF